MRLIACGRPFVFFFFLNDPATTEIYTLSLHDALPICRCWPNLPQRLLPPTAARTIGAPNYTTGESEPALTPTSTGFPLAAKAHQQEHRGQRAENAQRDAHRLGDDGVNLQGPTDQRALLTAGHVGEENRPVSIRS